MTNFFRDLGYRAIIGVIGLNIVAILIDLNIFSSVPIWIERVIFSLILILCAILYYGINVLWDKLKKGKEIKAKEDLIKASLGKKLSLDKLNSTFPEIKKIAIMGLNEVGKTTLIEHLCRKKTSNTTTGGKPSGYIHNFSNTSTKYAALLDAKGQSLAQQLKIAKEADFLVLLFDHNPKWGKSDTETNQNRVISHSNFLDQLIDALDNLEKYPSWIHILLNKEDLWSRSDNTTDLINFYDEAENRLNNKFTSKIEITKEHHANPLSDSITDILLTIEAKL